MQGVLDTEAHSEATPIDEVLLRSMQQDGESLPSDDVVVPVTDHQGRQERTTFYYKSYKCMGFFEEDRLSLY
ncbi:hypothetical protein PHMEG_0008386 [Phytophthora megakarya]|uniref:Uncharacterized protein n=1 Tax=Phytophthora megakarya TaxID=4795 RepID=A0A225WJ67_9STRA|nr:hypothetical protein PHMEG_0008386 [Phytophthora megakarya]